LEFAVHAVTALETLGATIAFVAMLGFFGCGVLEVGKGFFAVVGYGAEPGVGRAASLVHSALHGLELIFLAPLPYLAFLSVVKLVRATIEFEQDGDKNKLEDAHDLVGKVKRLITGLMIAVIATEIIHRTIGNEWAHDGGAYGGGPEVVKDAVMLTLMLFLTLYYTTANRK
jgi:hypothetical protein